ncbi:MAG TPA: hypothetical protein VMI94_10730 [Bryobacteraceae bacterium]|nr:hypothetical protein [Bryobacteraceae bacterium]
MPADEPEKPANAMPADTFAGLKLRAIGPAVTSGRVVSFAVDPHNKSTYYVGSASGGVWKTVNAGTSFTPVFDGEGSYSIGTVVIDPKDSNVVWVGTGENNSQRSVSYGDGIYRSDDGGKSWKNMGLKKSEHIARIAIDPRDSNTVYVAAEGPLWGPGGDRGLYKTTDGGKNWKAVLTISENTGVSDVVLDPRHPDVLLAAAYQRRRHVWTLIDGGPESAIYKSVDAGATWNKIKSGLPAENLGRIGFAVSPVNPDVVYASIESIDKKGGIFRSTDFGATWDRRNEHDDQAQYYAHIVADPKNVDRIYVMDVFLQVSDDGGKTLHNLGERYKHVDNHEIWIDPANTSHYLVGCDGGVYESFDRAATWNFKANLPVTQFYDIAVDEAAPFYHVYGGTQDNFSMGGPARTRSVHGITNQDWFVTAGGDGFHSRVDPKDPDTVYAESQYGGLVRFDRRTGESVGIQPQPGAGEPPLRWNWDSPILVSPHSHTRVYFAANKVFRSDDRGDSWKAVSGDLTRLVDRNTLPVMGKVWGPDAVAKNVSTSFYGNVVALAESPRKEGLLYAGTDDGLIQVTEDGGEHWRKIEKFPGVPEGTYVSRILASQHGDATAYAAFDHHKNSDFAPYLLKTTDAGRTWTPIQGDLPANGPVLAIAEDHVNPQLLFVGTEFGLYFTIDGGKQWIRLKGGLPTIAVRDLAIQRQMNDLVVATFGRGVYVLDDYTPLRDLKPETLKEDALLLPVKNALMYIQTRQYGLRGKGFQGESFFTADNPPYGAVFTYYLKDAIETRKQKRRDAEKEAEKKKTAIPYPTMESLRTEDEEEAPALLFTISDSSGRAIRTITGPVTKGIHRVSWDLREPPASLPSPRNREADDDLFYEEPTGPLVTPGRYTVSVAKRVDGVLTPIMSPREFTVEAESTTDAAGSRELLEFQVKVTKLQRAVAGALDTANELKSRIARIEMAIDATPAMDRKWAAAARALEAGNNQVLRALRGDITIARHNEDVPPSIIGRVDTIVGNESAWLQRPPGTDVQAYEIASREFAAESEKLRNLVEVDLKAIEKALDDAGAPWTPGRLPLR